VPERKPSIVTWLLFEPRITGLRGAYVHKNLQVFGQALNNRQIKKIYGKNTIFVRHSVVIVNVVLLEIDRGRKINV